MFVLVFSVALIGVTASPAMAQGRQAKAVIKEVAKKHGLSRRDTKALIILAKRESGWSNKNVTGSYVGLFQIHKSKYQSKRTTWEIHGKTYRGPRWQNPYANTHMAIKQIKAHYGSPSEALAHSYSHGWY